LVFLGLDGWTSISGASIYVFVLILPSKKEYIYSLEDLSFDSHTSEYISQKIMKIVETVGPEKISSVVSDNASVMVKAKKIINMKYNHIIPVRCIAHHINLLTADIMKHEHAKEVISKCMKIVKYFRNSHQAGAFLSQELKDTFVDGGGLKGYSKTRWTTAWDCLISVQRCKSSLHNVRLKFVL
jgi:hypothetical protein